MSILKIEKVGLIAHYSDQGDWAFKAAFDLASSNNWQLNVFKFLNSSFDMPLDKAPSELETPVVPEDTLISEDRRLREYYDDILGDYVNVGFRVCDSVRHNFELRSCLKKQEFHILFIPYLFKGVTFGNMPIEEFAYRFHAPIVLIGPEKDNQYHLNKPAHIVLDSLEIEQKEWVTIPKPDVFQELSVL